MSKYLYLFVSLFLLISLGIPTWLLLFFYLISFKVFWCFVFSIIITTIFLLAVTDRNELIREIINGEIMSKKIDAIEIFEDLHSKLCQLSAKINMKAHSINESETLVNSAKEILTDLELNRKNSAERYKNLLINLKNDVESTEKEVRVLQDEMKDLSRRRVDLKNEIIESFRESLANAKNILILSGSGISAESGIPTFRGAGGFWRTYLATSLATPTAFKNNPSLVWEFYEYRRDNASKAQPNKAHEAIANFELRLAREGRNVTIVTQNIDGLHQKAGAKNVIELHGSLYKTRCTKCDNVEINNTIPICPALAGKSSPDPDDMTSEIPVEDLPRCSKDSCDGLLRPHITWFGESLDTEILDAAEHAVESCDACLIIGTSSLVYPAAMFAPRVAERGIPVAEFNVEETDATRKFQYHFQGPCTITVAEALAP